MNNPFDYVPDCRCDEAFRDLTNRLGALKRSKRQEDIIFCREIEKGKMLGILIAEDNDGTQYTLKAFSGQIAVSGFNYPGFVEPIFDYLQPDGYFKCRDVEITRMNEEIEQYEKYTCSRVIKEFELAKEKLDTEIESFKNHCRLSKMERKTRRLQGVSEEESEAMIRQSQFEKAELHRLKKRQEAVLSPVESEMNMVLSQLDAMKKKRKSDSEALQNWLFSNTRVLNARGESKSLSEIFAETTFRIPPSGAGECCAPKLLQAAYRRGLRPVSIAEYWYGESKGGEVRIHGEHYPACRGKCLPILSWMLQGLEVIPPLESDNYSDIKAEPRIIYQNKWFCIVNKPSGMLSVPGKGVTISVQQWLSSEFGPDQYVRMVHRLDQDTSGLIIAALGERPYKILQSLFTLRQVQKTYIADLEGDYQVNNIPRTGRIEIPLTPDPLDRPRQRIDFTAGKPAVTDFEFTGVSQGRSRIIFHPRTGRTHQLRVHSASETGLGLPIVGDRLYGKKLGKTTERLHLHALRIEFTFPEDGQHYCFESPVPF